MFWGCVVLGFFYTPAFGAELPFFSVSDFSNNYHPSSYAHKFFGQQVGDDVLSSTVF